MEFMIPRWFLRYRDQNSSSGRKDRQQNICITTVIVTSHQHILMKNNGIIKKRAVLIRHDSMKDVGLDQKDVSRFGRDGLILVFEKTISRLFSRKIQMPTTCT